MVISIFYSVWLLFSLFLRGSAASIPPPTRALPIVQRSLLRLFQMQGEWALVQSLLDPVELPPSEVVRLAHLRDVSKPSTGPTQLLPSGIGLSAETTRVLEGIAMHTAFHLQEVFPEHRWFTPDTS